MALNNKSISNHVNSFSSLLHACFLQFIKRSTKVGHRIKLCLRWQKGGSLAREKCGTASEPMVIGDSESFQVLYGETQGFVDGSGRLCPVP